MPLQSSLGGLNYMQTNVWLGVWHTLKHTMNRSEAYQRGVGGGYSRFMSLCLQIPSSRGQCMSPSK